MAELDSALKQSIQESVFFRTPKVLVLYLGRSKALVLAEIVSRYLGILSEKIDDTVIINAKEFQRILGTDRVGFYRLLRSLQDDHTLKSLPYEKKNKRLLKLNTPFIIHLLNRDDKQYWEKFKDKGSHLRNKDAKTSEEIYKEFCGMRTASESENFTNTLVKSVKDQDKTWNDVEEKYRDIIVYWNGLEHTPKVRIPKSGDRPVSKTVLALVTYFRQLCEGSFFRYNKVADQFEEYEKTRRYEIEDIKSMMYTLNKLYSPEYYPKNKSILPRSLSNAFVDYTTKKCLIIHMIRETPKKLNNDYVPDKSIIELYNKLPGVSGRVWNINIKNSIIQLHDEYVIIKESVGKFYTWYGEWNKYLNTFEKFCTIHKKFLSAFKEIHPGHLSCVRGRKIWDRFCAYVMDTYKVNLYPSEAEIKIILQNRKRHLISSGQKTPMDFYGGGVCLMEEIS